MRIGFIADVHGNELALDAVLARTRTLALDRVVFLGDAIGYMPGELAVLDRLNADGIDCQKGNHEAMLLAPTRPAADKEAVYRLEGARERLAARTSVLAGWPDARAEVLDGQRFWMIHGSPSAVIDGYVYPDTALGGFAELPYDFVVLANTHRPFVRAAGAVTVVNTGSVGLPRDRGDLASFAVIDTVAGQATIYRVPIDVDAVIQRYGSGLHESVIACLRRQVPAVVGEVLS